MDNSAPSNPGLLGSARLLLASLLEIGHTRLQLASAELEEERLRVVELLLYATVSLFFLGIGLVMASLFVVVLFWDSQRELVLGIFGALYLGIGAFALIVWQRKARDKPRLLAATLEELRRDRVALSQIGSATGKPDV